MSLQSTAYSLQLYSRQVKSTGHIQVSSLQPTVYSYTADNFKSPVYSLVSTVLQKTSIVYQRYKSLQSTVYSSTVDKYSLPSI